jgi:hypothetical protein
METIILAHNASVLLKSEKFYNTPMEIYTIVYKPTTSITIKKVLKQRPKEINALAYNTPILKSTEKSFIVPNHAGTCACL